MSTPEGWRRPPFRYISQRARRQDAAATVGLNATQRAMRRLALDSLSLRTIGALRDAGVDCLLVKGPVTARWIYANTAEVNYCDVDLLVSPHSRQRAADVMRALGYRDYHAGVLGIYRPHHESSWDADIGTIDLHWSLAGIPELSWDDAWNAIWDGREAFDLHGARVWVPDRTARTLHLALHAALSPPGTKPRRDLELGLVRVELGTWRDAADLAERLGAGRDFWAALGRDTSSAELARRIGGTPRPSVSSVLYDRGACAEARAFQQLLDLPGRRTAALGGWLSQEGEHGDGWRRRCATVVARLPWGFVQWWSARHRAARFQPRRSMTGTS